jgi:catechol 2,3-dioxygenase-like lactoylglutathione lyase family enzyme
VQAGQANVPAMLQHVTLEVTQTHDYDATLARLSEHGFELHPGSNAWNAPRMFVLDPAGHRVEVMSRPPHPPWS